MTNVDVNEIRENYKKYLFEGIFYGTDSKGNRCVITNGKAKRFTKDADGKDVGRGFKEEYVILDMPEYFRVYIGGNGIINLLQTKAHILYSSLETLAKEKARKICPDKEIHRCTLCVDNGLSIIVDAGRCDEFGGFPHPYHYEAFIIIKMGDKLQLRLKQTSKRVYKFVGRNADNPNGYHDNLDGNDEKVIDELFFGDLTSLEIDEDALIKDNCLSKEDIKHSGIGGK